LPSDEPGSRRLSRLQGRELDAAWLALLLLNVAAIVVWHSHETIPFHVISLCFALLYWLRVWSADPLPWGLGIVLITTVTGVALDVLHDAGSLEEVTDIPLLATMFVAIVWHANRTVTADHERRLIGEKNARLLDAQRRFLQDASHHLRTPITIALTHAELLAQEVTGEQELRDIQMVIGEMTRLRRLSERLLVIAGSEDPDFLRSEPVALDEFALEVIERWQPTAQRRWKLGRLDAATVMADQERLGLAVDALLENAVKFTSADEIIELSVVIDPVGVGRLGVSDTGSGIPAEELPRVFDRFRTGNGDRRVRGTGLGLALVRAVAGAHGGSVTVHSTLGKGSDFAILLPLAVKDPVIESNGVSAAMLLSRGASR
jgi:two-component system OmpR family sensor kinase